ncbi:MAG: hypothetical protein QOE70_3269 [Chthoniobacter sp.]|nr:hypothetical protein [Chthoniobacter sp.]
MFALSSADFHKRILGCGDGPASFNAEWSAEGGRVVSVDPIYELGGPAIQRRFEEAAPGIISQLHEGANWVWGFHRNPEALRNCRSITLKRFLADYEAGRAAGRYRVGALPSLPFDDASFDLALCSHLLFLYTEMLSEQFHLRSVLELCRVAKEVRIFPLLTLAHERSPHLSAVCDAVAAQGWRAEVVQVAYEFQRGGNEMLLIQRT